MFDNLLHALLSRSSDYSPQVNSLNGQVSDTDFHYFGQSYEYTVRWVPHSFAAARCFETPCAAARFHVVQEASIKEDGYESRETHEEFTSDTVWKRSLAGQFGFVLPQSLCGVNLPLRDRVRLCTVINVRCIEQWDVLRGYIALSDTGRLEAERIYSYLTLLLIAHKNHSLIEDEENRGESSHKMLLDKLTTLGELTIVPDFIVSELQSIMNSLDDVFSSETVKYRANVSFTSFLTHLEGCTKTVLVPSTSGKLYCFSNVPVHRWYCVAWLYSRLEYLHPGITLQQLPPGPWDSDSMFGLEIFRSDTIHRVLGVLCDRKCPHFICRVMDFCNATGALIFFTSADETVIVGSRSQRSAVKCALYLLNHSARNACDSVTGKEQDALYYPLLSRERLGTTSPGSVGFDHGTECRSDTKELGIKKIYITDSSLNALQGTPIRNLEREFNVFVIQTEEVLRDYSPESTQTLKGLWILGHQSDRVGFLLRFLYLCQSIEKSHFVPRYSSQLQKFPGEKFWGCCVYKLNACLAFLLASPPQHPTYLKRLSRALHLQCEVFEDEIWCFGSLASRTLFQWLMETLIQNFSMVNTSLRTSSRTAHVLPLFFMQKQLLVSNPIVHDNLDTCLIRNGPHLEQYAPSASLFFRRISQLEEHHRILIVPIVSVLESHGSHESNQFGSFPRAMAVIGLCPDVRDTTLSELSKFLYDFERTTVSKRDHLYRIAMDEGICGMYRSGSPDAIPPEISSHSSSIRTSETSSSTQKSWSTSYSDRSRQSKHCDRKAYRKCINKKRRDSHASSWSRHRKRVHSSQSRRSSVGRMRFNRKEYFNAHERGYVSQVYRRGRDRQRG